MGLLSCHCETINDQESGQKYKWKPAALWPCNKTVKQFIIVIPMKQQWMISCCAVVKVLSYMRWSVKTRSFFVKTNCKNPPLQQQVQWKNHMTWLWRTGAWLRKLKHAHLLSYCLPCGFTNGKTTCHACTYKYAAIVDAVILLNWW